MNKIKNALIGLAIGLIGATNAAAQSLTGPFQPWQNPPAFATTTNPNGPGGSFILGVDDDNNIVTPPVEYNLTQQAPELANKDEYTVSPQRDVLFVLEDNTSSPSPSRIWFANLDGAGGVTITHGPFSIQGAGVQRLGGPHYFDVAGEVQKIAIMFFGQPTGFPDFWVQVFDLNTPGLAGQARVNLAQGRDLAPSRFAPSGTHLVIKNGLSDADPDINYTLISLCPSVFGQAGIIQLDPVRITTGGEPEWRVENVSMGTLDVVGQIPAEANAFFASTYDDCTDQVAQPTGACCFTSFGLPTCVDGVTQAACDTVGGTFFQDTTCATACPTPALTIQAAAPASVVATSPITYTLTISSTGGAAATNAAARFRIPAFVEYLSATGNPTFTGTEVTWSLGDLLPGAVETRTVTVGTDCGDIGRFIDVRFGDARVTSDNAPAANASPISTDVVAPATEAVPITIVSTPESGEPMRQGDRAIHTITITNNATTDRSLSVPGGGFMTAGINASFDGPIDAGVGSFETASTTGLRWTGTVPAGTTTQFSFATRLDCVTDNIQAHQLNSGSDIFVRNECFAPVGQVSARAIPIQRPVAARVEVLNPTPGLIGPRREFPSFSGRTEAANTARPGAPLTIMYSLTNTSGGDLPNALIQRVLPADLSIGSPPFAAPVPAGAAYDSATRTISWQGPLADGETVDLRVNLLIAADADCAIDGGFSALSDAGTASTCTNTRGNQTIFIVPEPPAGPQILINNFFRGLESVDVTTFSSTPVFCPITETSVNSAISPSGTVYTGGLPGFYINQRTLDFDVQLDVAGGFGTPAVIGIDPDADAALFGIGSTVVRYRGAGTEQTLVDLTQDGLSISAVGGSPGGVVLVIANGRLFRFDTAAAPAPLTLTDATEIAIPQLDLGLDASFGNLQPTLADVITPDAATPVVLLKSTYLTSDFSAGVNFSALAELDLQTNSLTVFEPVLSARTANLPQGLPPSVNPLLVSFLFSVAIDSDDNGDVWISDGSNGRATRYERGPRLASGFPAPFIAGIAVDTGVVACNPADLAVPLGVLDIDDVLTFLNAFTAGDAAADLAPPIGTLDIEDVTMFLNLFAAGCRP